MTKNEEYLKIAQELLGEEGPESDIERIHLVLCSWEKQISSEAFPIFKHIVSLFNFYSTRKAVDTFINLNKQEKYLSKNEPLFLPLRTKDRMETSISLFSTLSLSLPFKINRTNMDDSSSVLRKIYNKKREYAQAGKLAGDGTVEGLIESPLTTIINKYNRQIIELKKQKTELEEEKKR